MSRETLRDKIMDELWNGLNSNSSMNQCADAIMALLTPLPMPDADVVERVARAISEATLTALTYGKGPAYPSAKAAITALTSSGYTRSPKPVNQMMLEALKRAKEFAIEWRGHIDDAGHIDASDEIEETIRAAIAAGSEE